MTSTTAAPSKNHYVILDGLRGVASVMVVAFHLFEAHAGGDPQKQIINHGYMAVDFFFLLSGFVIWLSWAERLRTGGWRVVPLFLRKRVARIWPLHLFVLGCAVALALLLLATGRHHSHFEFNTLPLHVLLLQNWGFTDHLSWNAPSWSISAELGAYLLFPLLAFAIDWRRMPTPAILASIVAFLFLLHATLAYNHAPTLGTDIARFGLVRCLLEFASGSAIAALWLRWRDTPILPALGAACVAVPLFMAWATRMLPETFAIPMAFAATLLALALTSGVKRNPLEITPLHYLGEISYATYLGHFMLFVVFKLAFVEDARAIPAALIALYLAMVFVSSVALYHLVERPAQRWVNQLKLPGRRREGKLTPQPVPPQVPQSTPG